MKLLTPTYRQQASWSGCPPPPSLFQRCGLFHKIRTIHTTSPLHTRPTTPPQLHTNANGQHLHIYTHTRPAPPQLHTHTHGQHLHNHTPPRHPCTFTHCPQAQSHRFCPRAYTHVHIHKKHTCIRMYTYTPLHTKAETGTSRGTHHA